jgi:GWxTD domain-containing protein
MSRLKAIRSLSVLITTTIVFTLLYSCKSTLSTYDPKDLSYLYNPIKNPVNPRYNIVNTSDNESVFSVKFFANELMFSEANPEGVPTALILVTVKLFNLSQGKVLADTAVYNLSIVRQKGQTEYNYKMPLKVEQGNDYLAEVKILDRLRLNVVQAFVTFNTMSDKNRYNFITRGNFEKNELFNPILRVNEYVNLVYTRGNADSLYVSYFKPFKEIPEPPSMLLPEKVLDYESEKTAAIKYSDTLPLMLPREGIYLCSVDRKVKDGYTFLNLGTDFPYMKTPEAMIEPVAYLKAALDEFWIKCGGNVDKARELIRIYYTRVLYSNYYFTSYKEGWRTERGMIYIMYGPPDKVYKSNEGESWGYIKPVLKSSWGGRYTVNEEYLFFNFKKRNSIYSDNDFFLSRSETLVTYWDKAVSSWKKGVVFRLDNPEGI